MSSFPILYNAFSHFSGNDCQVFAVLIHFLSNSKNELLDVLSNLVLFYFCPWFSFLKNPFLPPALSPSVNFPEWMLAFVSLPLRLRISALWTDSALEQSLILFPCGQHAWSVWFLPLKVSVGFYIWSEAASTPGHVLQMPIQNAQLSAENKGEWYYFHNHLQCSLTQVGWQLVFWFCSRLGMFLHFLTVAYLFSWIEGHW